MSTEYSDKVNNKIKNAAMRAFDLLKDEPVEAHEQAKASRQTLYSWLVQLQQFTKSPAHAVTDADMVVFEAAGGGRAGVQAIFDNLAKTQKGILVSRQDANFLWEQTGFHADLEVNAVYAKVGKNAYQPIGFDDGSIYIPLEGSKTLWTREFAFATLEQLEPAFKIEKVADKKDADFDKAYLSEEQVSNYREVISWFDEDLKLLLELNAKGDALAEIDDLKNKMKETVKLARIRVPALDAKLTEMEAKYGDVTGDMFKFVTACREFLDLHLNENEVRKKITTTELMNREGSDKQAIAAILKSLEPLIDSSDKLTTDDDTVASSISAAMLALPTLRAYMGEVAKDAGIADGLKLAINHLKAALHE